MPSKQNTSPKLIDTRLPSHFLSLNCQRILPNRQSRSPAGRGTFGAGQPGEVDAALAFDAAARALGSARRATNASERTNFEVPGQGARGLSREQAADVEARLERHLRAALLAAGRAKGVGEEFERELPQQMMPAPAACDALPQ